MPVHVHVGRRRLGHPAAQLCLKRPSQIQLLAPTPFGGVKVWIRENFEGQGKGIGLALGLVKSNDRDCRHRMKS